MTRVMGADGAGVGASSGRALAPDEVEGAAGSGRAPDAGGGSVCFAMAGGRIGSTGAGAGRGAALRGMGSAAGAGAGVAAGAGAAGGAGVTTIPVDVGGETGSGAGAAGGVVGSVSAAGRGVSWSMGCGASGSGSFAETGTRAGIHHWCQTRARPTPAASRTRSAKNGDDDREGGRRREVAGSTRWRGAMGSPSAWGDSSGRGSAWSASPH
jgi:hypothetical protein